MIRREFSISLFLVLIISIYIQFSPAIAASGPVVLSDDTLSVSSTQGEGDNEFNYTFNVQPGKYAVIAVLHGIPNEDASSYRSFLSVFSDASYSQSVSYTEFNAMNPKIDPKNVKFFCINGINLENENSYYAQCGYIDSPGTPGYKLKVWYRIEIENGNNTGMRILDVNSSVTGEIKSEIFDAYQVYLEADRAYNITLTGGSTSCYDLYLSNGSTLASSCITTWGANETIVSFIPEKTGYFCLIVTNPVWSNAEYELEIKRVKPIILTTPSTDEPSSDTGTTTPTTNAGSFPGLFIILGCLATLVIVIRRHKKI